MDVELSVHYQPKNFQNSMAQFFARLDWRPIRAPRLLGLKSTLRAQYKATALIVPSSSSKSNLFFFFETEQLCGEKLQWTTQVFCDSAIRRRIRG